MNAKGALVCATPGEGGGQSLVQRHAPLVLSARDHRHYSRFVSLMRILLPGLGILLAGVVAAWPRLNGSSERFSLGSVDRATTGRTEDSSSVVNARYHGTDREHQPFTITAEFATESVLKHLNLTAPKADITLREGAWLAVGAESGRYRHDDKLLELEGNVSLFHDGGYQLHTNTARFDFNDGIVSGDSPVDGQGPFGTVSGEGFRLRDRGRTLVLTGRSRLWIESSQEKDR
ncbi:MAG: hypothetical protein FD149_511 [Rhodospirillaceae bacterium]|nr:MAG: hypothetical protein FD149_511 [Rhodospirillaceae bacterium]